MQVIIRGIQPTESFAPTLDAINDAEFGDDPVVPDDEPEDLDDDSDGGLGDLAFLLGLLPILSLLGLAG